MNYSKFIFALLIIIMTSCDTLSKREKLIDEIESHFWANREMYDTLKNYFVKPGSYEGFAFSYKDERITLKYGKNPIIIDSISQVDDKREVHRILIFMKREKIRDISGNREWISVSREESKMPCYSFWYRANFNSTGEEVKQKINNFKDTDTKDWIYILDDKWFIKGEACF